MIRAIKQTASILGVAVCLGAALDASALPITFFDSTANDGTGGGTISLAPGSGAHTINIYATTGAFVFGVNLGFTATGSVSISKPPTPAPGGSCVGPDAAWASCQVNALMPDGSAAGANNYATLLDQSNTGLNPGTYRIGTVTINVGAGAGSFAFSFGTAVDDSFGNVPIDGGSQILDLVTVIPEPGTLVLLGAGLSGLMLVGGRRD